MEHRPIGTVPPARSIQRKNTYRLRLWTLAGVVISSMLPLAFNRWLNADPGSFASQQETFFVSILAAVISSYMLANLSTFPGVRAISSSCVLIMSLYGAGFLAVLFARLDYSRFQLTLSLALYLAWYISYYYAVERRAVPRVALIPIGAAKELLEIGGVRWVDISQPFDRRRRFDMIVADFHGDLSDEWETFLADCALLGTPVYHVKQLKEMFTGRVEIEHLSENSFGSLIPRASFKDVKFVFDWLLALAALPLLVALILVVGTAIRMGSPGPIFFRQKRIGYRGATLSVLKFRTMTQGNVDAGSALESAITKDADHRVTRIGRLLRRTRIDEVPQLWNILRGEMSWIGPRPEAEVLSQWYEAELPFYRYRHIVRPGISGWAQVNQGHVAEVSDVLWKLHYDFYYIKNFSLWLDLLIVFKTVRTVFTGNGAK